MVSEDDRVSARRAITASRIRCEGGQMLKENLVMLGLVVLVSWRLGDAVSAISLVL